MGGGQPTLRLHGDQAVVARLLRRGGEAAGGEELDVVVSGFGIDDLTTWKRDVAWLTGVRYAGVVDR